MSKTNTFENDYLKLIFNNIAIGLIGDSAGLQPAAAAGNLYLALHTADPGEAADQTTNEVTYTGYSRLPVARSSSGFTVTNNAVRLVNNADFGNCTASPGSPATYFSIGTSATGTGKALYTGILAPQITMAVGVTPRITNTADIVTED